jgi:LuxR family maltose regulon positive regulatory protein
LSGEIDEMQQLLKQLSSTSNNGMLPDGAQSVESTVALIRGLFGFDGPVGMLAAARRAAELETDGNTRWYGVANTALGHASYVAGDLSTAVDLLPRGAHSEAAPALIRVLAFSVLALTHAELGQHDRSRKAAEEAMAVVETRSMHALPQIALAFTAFGQSQAASGRLEDAMTTLDHGLALRRNLPGLSPWPTMHHLLVMGRVAVMAGDPPSGRQLLDEAAVMIRRYPQGMAAMITRLDAARKSLRESKNGELRTEHLTAREIDILRKLATPQSLSQIASELYVSPNTVKTHTLSLYRKLGARSRDEAVRIGRERLLI